MSCCDVSVPITSFSPSSTTTSFTLTECILRGSSAQEQPLVHVSSAADVEFVKCQFRSGTVGVSVEGKVKVSDCLFVGQQKSSFLTYPSSSLFVQQSELFGGNSCLIGKASSQIVFKQCKLYNQSNGFHCIDTKLLVLHCTFSEILNILDLSNTIVKVIDCSFRIFLLF
ncbi:hypothetical protein GEMRC1_008102 [Eukaryota sp. GEM-RC1]